jgi:Uma2 family endonuclease
MSTTTITPPPTQTELASVATFFRLTVEEYHNMIHNGILTTEDRVELLDGYLVNKMPQNNPHSSTVDRLTEDLIRLIPPGWRSRIQLPIRLANSEPEPDAAIVRGDRRTFDHRRPLASDFGIVIEVADSSLALDRREKSRLYAEAGISIYWIINLVDWQIEVYTDPQPTAAPPSYATRTDYRPGQSVPLVLEGVTVGTIPVADLLP